MSTSTLPAPANGSKLRPMVGAVTYIRVSTKEQTENLSLSTQLKACEEYCERQGFEAVDGELVERAKRLLRVLPLPPRVPRSEHREDEA